MSLITFQASTLFSSESPSSSSNESILVNSSSSSEPLLVMNSTHRDPIGNLNTFETSSSFLSSNSNNISPSLLSSTLVAGGSNLLMAPNNTFINLIDIDNNSNHHQQQLHHNNNTNNSHHHHHHFGVANATSLPIINSYAAAATTELATVNYNGLIGFNATDPYAFTTESARTFAIPVQIQILMCLFYGTLAFTAVASNMIVCYIVLSNQRMRTATNYFIVNLAVGDILMALLCIPFSFAANLIFQYWPFGLSLCVMVSYSQANSVFISAYTMVAISIDKYLAIMYPMRLRMPKIQAKVIILVIWSAALITSLPTALLSSLDSIQTSPTASAASVAPFANPAVNLAPSAAPSSGGGGGGGYGLASSILTNSSSSSSASNLSLPGTSAHSSPTTASIFITTQEAYSDSSNGTTTTITNNNNNNNNNILPSEQESIAQQQQQQQEQEQKKYSCQESWIFWPRGKYYYSMALMILQFVVPLFVLVITYTRIVIAVWGKRMPGEEDNARDARMARSKRKWTEPHDNIVEGVVATTAS